MKRISAPAVLNEPSQYTVPVPFSRGVRVNLPGFSLLIISGTASVGPNGETLHEGDFPAQAARMFENITALLELEGASWKHVVKTTLFLKDMAYYAEFSALRVAFFKEQGITIYPASTCVQATLCRPELLCEMEAMAIMGDKS